MKIQIDTQNKSGDKRAQKHSHLYVFLGFCVLVFALLYVYGYILYTK
jgi:hypothetical protein